MKGDILPGFDFKIRKNILTSIERNDEPTFRKLLSFMREVLGLSINQSSQELFEQYIFLPVLFYGAAFKRNQSNPAYARLLNVCAEMASMHLKEIIWFEIGREDRMNKGSSNSINRFYYLAFYSFSTLLYRMITNRDVQYFEDAINEFGQLTESESYGLKLQISSYKERPPEEIDQAELADLEARYEFADQYNKYKRHVITGLRYWVYYTYATKTIDEGPANKFVEKLNTYAGYEDMLNDILFFRSAAGNASFGWSDWDYMERPEGQVYYPPTPHNWMTFGFTVDLIKGGNFYIDIENVETKELPGVRFLYDDVNNALKKISTDFSHWAPLLQISKEEFDIRCERILHAFAVFKQQSVEDKEKEIAESELDEGLMKTYVDAVGGEWQKAAMVRELFDQYGGKHLVTDPEHKLMRIGPNIFFRKAKMMFVKNHYEHIHGVEQLGGQIGREEDNLFFDRIIRSASSKKLFSSEIEFLDYGISELAGQHQANVVFIPRVFFRTRGLTSSDKFIPQFKATEHPAHGKIGFVGLYQEIPVFASHSKLLSNRLVIANFEHAFKMLYKKNDEWYNELLNIQIKPVTDDIARNKLEQEPDYWTKTEENIELNEEQAITLIKTSIIIDAETILEFEIVNQEALIVGHIVKPEDIS